MKREDYKEIEMLIEKYFNAETSLEEESRIKDYYRATPHAEIPEAIRSYSEMFGFFESEKSYIDVPVMRSHSFYTPMLRWGTVAAAALLLVGFFLFNTGGDNSFRLIINGESVKNSQLAVDVANDRLDKVNSLMQQLNKANSTLNSVAKVERALSPMEKVNSALTQNKQ